jgi:cell division protein FtsB
VKIKRALFRTFFALEAVIFMGTYLFGAQGIRVMRQLTAADHKLDQDIAAISHEIDQLNNEIVAWQSDDFYKEKVARERLHMARKNETIYYIS